jgi:nucleoside-diphosphate-sugar epimerase
MRVLFIGGTGNISSDCAERLAAEGHELLLLSRGRVAVPAQFQALRADRKDPAALRAALGERRVDVVVNFLGYEPEDVRTDFRLFAGQVRQYLFISSATVYVKPPPRLPITEDTPLGNPWWDYASKKIACEQWLLEQYRQNGFPITIVRPSHTYSRLWIPNPVSSAGYSFAARLEQGLPVFVPGDGENPWTLTAASDFAVGLAGLVGRTDAVGEAFHITSDEVLTWNQIVAAIAEALGVRAPNVVRIPAEFICQTAPQLTGTLKGDKIHPGIFDNSKLKRFVPGFACRKSFRVGVRESIAWLRKAPPAQAVNPKVDELCELVIGAWNRRGV